MLSLDVLAVALAVEGALIACALGGLVLLRMFLVARARHVAAGVARLEPLLHHWLVDDTPPDAIVRELRAMPTYVAFRSVARLATGYLTFERQQRLAPLLRSETGLRRIWVHHLLCLATPESEPVAARLVGSADDDASSQRGLVDKHSGRVVLVGPDAERIGPQVTIEAERARQRALRHWRRWHEG